MTNLAGQAVNSTEVPGVPRPRPIEGLDASLAALRDSPPLSQLPLAVRDSGAASQVKALLPEAADRVFSIEVIEEMALAQTREPNERWRAGERARNLELQQASLDEARSLSSRLFYCLSGLSITQRRRVRDSLSRTP